EAVAAAPDAVLGFSKSELLHAAEPLALAVIGVLVLLLVVKPIVSRILETPAGGRAAVSALAGPEGQRLLAAPATGTARALPPPPPPPGRGAARAGAGAPPASQAAFR